jgi:hypothetical protein
MCTYPSVYAYLRKNKEIKVTNEKEINKKKKSRIISYNRQKRG